MKEFSKIELTPVTQTLARDNEEGTLAYGYMCRIDFECEIGRACGGNIVYPSIEDIKRNRKCVESCGIVKVAVVAVEIVEEGNDYD